MRKFLMQRGIIVNSPREVFSYSASEELIDNLDIWFDFIEKRNITFHSYEEAEAAEVLDILPLFSTEIKKFLVKVGVNEANFRR